MAYAHAAKSTGQLCVIVARHLAQAHSVEDSEHRLAGGDFDRLAVEMDGHVSPRQGLDVEFSIQCLHSAFRP
ncbi:hypothetical protein D3C85_1480280 [compost metagenome]